MAIGRSSTLPARAVLLPPSDEASEASYDGAITTRLPESVHQERSISESIKQSTAEISKGRGASSRWPAKSPRRSRIVLNSPSPTAAKPISLGKPGR